MSDTTSTPVWDPEEAEASGDTGQGQEAEPSVAYIGPGNPGTEVEALELVEQAARDYGVIAVDTETVSLKNRTCIGLGISCHGHRVYLSVESEYFDRALELPANPHLKKVYHNAAFDLGVLWDTGHWRGVVYPDWGNIADTSTMAQVQGLPANLSVLAARVLGIEIKEISDILPERQDMTDVAFAITAAKCMDDVKATEALYYKMGGPEWDDLTNPHDWQPSQNIDLVWILDMPSNFHVSSRIKDCYHVDVNLLPILHRMGRAGLSLRKDRVRAWHDRLSTDMLTYGDVCQKIGFNPGSNQQVGYVLAARGNMLPFTDTRKQLKVDEKILRKMEDPLAQVVLNYRKAQKLRGTYIEPCLEADRFYTHYRVDLATGRLASFDRNVQNIPPEVREIFEPDSGTWTDADASQVEMRMWAYQTQDPTMLKAYREGANVHLITQAALWPKSRPKEEPIYTKSKTFNYAMIFDADEDTLSENTGIPVKQCGEFRKTWLQTYPVGALKMVEWKREECQWVESDFGRRMRLPDLATFGEKHRNNCKLNYRPQGTAADIIKRCMILADAIGLPQVVQVHDEILFDGLVEIPDEWGRLHPGIATPFDTRVGPDWY
jgi:DNA polymerase I-like protein with 3'-5' exonuclease and polymerase domains